MTDTHWHDMPFRGLALDRLTWLGGGKDSDLQIHTVDGRVLYLPVDSLSVTASPGLQIRTTRVGDVSLRIDYSAPGLTVRRMRARFPDPDQRWQEKFGRSLAAWLESGGEEALTWCVEVEVEFADD